MNVKLSGYVVLAIILGILFPLSSLKAQKHVYQNESKPVPQSSEKELTFHNNDKYKYQKLTQGGERHLLIGGNASFSLEPKLRSETSQNVYYGRTLYVFKPLDKRYASLYRNDTLVAEIRKDITIGDAVYAVKQDNSKKWKVLRGNEVVISVVYEKNKKDKTITLSYEDSLPDRELLTVVSLYKGYLTVQNNSMDVGLILGSVVLVFITTRVF